MGLNQTDPAIVKSVDDGKATGSALSTSSSPLNNSIPDTRITARDWRPIATAPPRERILVFYPPQRQLPAMIQIHDNYWEQVAATRTRFIPTHWMPLPAPPGHEPGTATGFVPEDQRVRCVDSPNDQHGYECVLCGHRLSERQAEPGTAEGKKEWPAFTTEREQQIEGWSAGTAEGTETTDTYHDSGLPLATEVYGFLEVLDVDWSDFEVDALTSFIRGRIDAAMTDPARVGPSSTKTADSTEEK